MMPEQLWRFIGNYQLPRAPGEQFLYSNLGLRAARARHRAPIENATEDQLYARIITGPLGMRDTAIELSPAPARAAGAGLSSERPAGAGIRTRLSGDGRRRAVRSTLERHDALSRFRARPSRRPAELAAAGAASAAHAAGPNGSVGLGWQMRERPNG